MFTFWMVLKRGGGTPTKEHHTEASAVAEAERLAKEFPGSVFVVLLAVDAFKATAPVQRKTLKPANQHPHDCQCDDWTIPF
jgi:hypothetical protein